MAKKAAGCTGATLRAYRSWIKRYQAQAGDATAALTVPAVTAFFAQLRERNLSASTIHQAYRSLKTFTRWLQAVGAIECNPLTGVNMRTPPTLPQVPTDEELCAVLEACRPTLEGIRNRALILVMADAGLHASEILGLLVEHWNPAERSLIVRSGKGRKDRVSFVGAATARAIKAYLGMRPLSGPEDWLFTGASGRPLTARHLVQVLHRLSARAGLPLKRRLHPHALRHYAGTSWLRNGVGLDQVRRLLGHSSLHTTLRYSNLVAADLQRAHRDAGALDSIMSRIARLRQREGSQEAHSVRKNLLVAEKQ